MLNHFCPLCRLTFQICGAEAVRPRDNEETVRPHVEGREGSRAMGRGPFAAEALYGRSAARGSEENVLWRRQAVCGDAARAHKPHGEKSRIRFAAQPRPNISFFKMMFSPNRWTAWGNRYRSRASPRCSEGAQKPGRGDLYSFWQREREPSGEAVAPDVSWRPLHGPMLSAPPV